MPDPNCSTNPKSLNTRINSLFLGMLLQLKKSSLLCPGIKPPVLTAVATIAGPIIPAGFTLPYWLWYGCVKLRLKNCSPICLISFHYHNSIPDLHVKALHLL